MLPAPRGGTVRVYFTGDDAEVAEIVRRVVVAGIAVCGVEPSDFDHSATLRDLRLVLWRELGPGGAAVGTLAERLQDDAAARLRTRLRALLAEVVGEGDSRHNVSGGDGDSPA